MNKTGLLIIIFLIGAMLALLAGSHLDAASGASVNNFLNIHTVVQTVTDASFFAIMAIGMTMVIISGGIDLSVGSIYALSGVLTAMTLQNTGMGDGSTVTSALFLCLGIGLLCGLLNGIMVVGLQVHPFIITLGTMWIFRGMAFVASRANSLAVPQSLTEVIKATFGLGAGIYPVPFIIMAVVTILGTLYLNKTVMGRHIYAVGGNIEASRYAGLKTGRILIGVYAVSGLCAGLSAFIGGAYYGSVSCADATGYELYVIASAVVGGASLIGGKGEALGGVLGALLIILIRQSIRTLHLDQNYEWIIIGCAIVIAVVLDQFGSRWAASKKKGPERASRAPRTGRILVVILLVVACLIAIISFGSGSKPEGVAGQSVPTFKIALIAKSSTNPVFLSARAGAEAAAKDLSKLGKVKVEIDWRTPPTEDGQVQAQRLAQAVNEGASAVTISCSDAGKVTGAINDAVSRGVPVMTFDSDAPESKRFAYYGVNDVDAGAQVMAELIKALGEKGNVAILAGNQNAPNLQKRAEGARKEAEKYPGIRVTGVFYNIETPQDAAAEVVRVTNAYPEITGWAMVGGWPLFTETLLKDLDPKKVKVVAIDALPIELPYIETGIAPVLLAQPTYMWGSTSVRTIYERFVNKNVDYQVPPMQLVRVTKENLGQWARQLRDWGFTDVQQKYLEMR